MEFEWNFVNFEEKLVDFVNFEAKRMDFGKYEWIMPRRLLRGSGLRHVGDNEQQ